MSLLSRITKPVAEPPAEGEEGPRPRTRSVGEILRDRREELGLDLEGVGESLRIKPAYLAALEQGRSDELPGPAYVIGFVRAYARHLGFDSEKVLARFRTESSALQARPDLTLPVPLGERSLPGATVLVVALILALCGYGTWYYLSTGDHGRPERVAAVPAELKAATAGPDADQGQPPEPSRPSAVPPQAASANPAAETPAAAASPKPAASEKPTMVSGLFGSPDQAAPDASAGRAAPVSVDATTAAPDAALAEHAAVAVTPPGDRPKPRLASAESTVGAGSRIAIKAVSDCWIQVRGSDQSILFSRVLKQGEVYQVPAKPGLALRTGNAGALQVTVDGKAVPSIGGVGTLRRNVALDPDALLQGTAVHG